MEKSVAMYAVNIQILLAKYNIPAYFLTNFSIGYFIFKLTTVPRSEGR